MAYIGAEPVPGQNREVDDISSGFNGNATAFTLQVNSVNVSPESAKNILINLGGVLQNPDTDYTINASTLTFTTAPASGLSFFGLILGAGINTATVADGAITTAKLASDAVGANQLANTSVTAGSYTTADITVDAQGRITAAASGTIANAEIADGAVNNAKVNASAAIAGTKISPDFGSQNIATTGTAATGALTVTGAITASTSITATNNLTTNGNFTISGTNPNIFLTDTNNDSDFRISNSNGVLEFRDTTNSVTRFQIASDGTSTFTDNVSIADTILHTGDTNTKIRFPTNDAISFETNGAEKVRFNSGGVLFGTTTQRAGFFNTGSQFSPHFQIEGAGDSDDAGRTNSIIYNSTTNAGPVLIFGKTMGSSVGSTTAVTNGAQLGMISFQGLIGSEFTMGASIVAQVNGSIGDNDLPTDLQFATTSDGGSSASTKMTLNAAGNLNIGLTSSPVSSNSEQGVFLAGVDATQSVISSSTTPLVINRVGTGGNDRNCVEFRNNGTLKGTIGALGPQNGVFLQTNGSERVRIHSSGELSIATTSKNLQGGGASDFYVNITANTGTNHNGVVMNGIASAHSAFNTKPSANHQYFAAFYLNSSGSGVGSISVGSSSTTFNTSSDYRLKENVTSLSDGITRLKQLLPKRFNWISDETNTLQDGFLAHEVSSLVPEAVTGEKDAVATENGGQYAKGDPIYQTIDHSKLVPLLTAALKESITKIETLETKVAALEAA